MASTKDAILAKINADEAAWKFTYMRTLGGGDVFVVEGTVD